MAWKITAYLLINEDLLRKGLISLVCVDFALFLTIYESVVQYSNSKHFCV